MKKYILITILIITIFTILIYVFVPFCEKMEEKFKGICLFDVDDTLTTGSDNYNVVQKCLDAGYVVGISTANPSYTPISIKEKHWMPQNLYNFMVQHQFDTFNNVSTFYLNGKIQKDVYIKNQPSEHILGWRKGISLLSTANLYGINDPKKMIIVDDNRDYIKGILSYNNNVKAICSGRDCGGSLNIETVLNSLQN